MVTHPCQVSVSLTSSVLLLGLSETIMAESISAIHLHVMLVLGCLSCVATEIVFLRRLTLLRKILDHLLAAVLVCENVADPQMQVQYISN